MYEDYHLLYKKHRDAERRYNEALEEKSKLILAVMPKATEYKEVMSQGGHSSPDTHILDYTERIGGVDALINQSRNTRDMLAYELKKMESAMRETGDVYDKIYIYRWIEHKSVYKFYRLLGYSKSQVYNYIDEMKKKIYKNVSLDKIGQN